MVDIHCHLLPGFSDAPESMSEALALARQISTSGVHSAIAVAHFDSRVYEPSAEEIKRRAALLCNSLSEEKISLSLTWAAEIALSDAEAMTPDELRAYSIGGLGRHVLVEAPEQMAISDIQQALFRIRLRGVRTILTHPERIVAFRRDPRAIAESVWCGVLVQVSAGSLLGHDGKLAKQTVEAMVRGGHVHFVGSESSNCGGRYHCLKSAGRALRALVGKAGVRRLLESNPKVLLSPDSRNTIRPARPRKKLFGLF